MPFVTMFDDDPDTGKPGYRTYEVLHVTGRGAISLVGEMTQRVHPTDSIRAHGVSDVGLYPPTPVKVAKCFCGRVKSRGASRCKHCASLDRRSKPMLSESLPW